MKDVINNYLSKVFSTPMYVNVLYLMCVIYIIFIAPSISEEFVDIYYNIVIQTSLLILIFVVTNLNKNLGVILMLSYVITISYVYVNHFTKKNIENFDIVEDNLDNVIVAEQNSLLKKLENEGDDFVGIWSDSVIGRELGLDKA
jgi:hypothetical protein